jgi:hypothetical protein
MLVELLVVFVGDYEFKEGSILESLTDVNCVPIRVFSKEFDRNECFEIDWRYDSPFDSYPVHCWKVHLKSQYLLG